MYTQPNVILHSVVQTLITLAPYSACLSQDLNTDNGNFIKTCPTEITACVTLQGQRS